MQKIRVMMADDNAEMLVAASTIVASEFEAPETFLDGDSLLAAIFPRQPELIILDVGLGESSGFDVARQLAARGCSSKVLFLTVNEQEEFVNAGLAIGALGYVFKSQLSEDLIPAMKSALAGRQFVSGRR